MTNKELYRLAVNEEALYYLDEIRRELLNMCHKSMYERKTAKLRISAAANVIRTLLIEDSIDEKR